MKHSVSLTPEAEGDLIDIYRHVAVAESLDRANRLLDQLEKACNCLASLPARGHLPVELQRLGVVEFREIHLEPYRILCEIDEETVAVHAVLDGRRDMQELLERRLLRE